MQTNVRSFLYVVGLFITMAALLSRLQALPVMAHPSLSVLFDPMSASDALFDGGCSERVALRSALCQLLGVRLDVFLCDATLQSQLSVQQRRAVTSLKRKLGDVSYSSNRSIKTSLACVAAFADFRDVGGLYNLLGCIDDGMYDNKFSSGIMLPGFPFDDLIAKVPADSIKIALLGYKNGSAAALSYLVAMGSPEEQRVAVACCATMLIAINDTIICDVRGVASCINLIQIYEQVEHLPIESVLQSMHCLIQRMGIMIANLNREEDGFVGWLRHKWVYLPVAMVIIMLRIAKYYWGGQSLFGSCFNGSNYWGSQYSQPNSTAQFGANQPMFETRAIEKRDSNINKETAI